MNVVEIAVKCDTRKPLQKDNQGKAWTDVAAITLLGSGIWELVASSALNLHRRHSLLALRIPEVRQLFSPTVASVGRQGLGVVAERLWLSLSGRQVVIRLATTHATGAAFCCQFQGAIATAMLR